jgi:hypothetical protein
MGGGSRVYCGPDLILSSASVVGRGRDAWAAASLIKTTARTFLRKIFQNFFFEKLLFETEKHFKLYDIKFFNF